MVCQSSVIRSYEFLRCAASLQFVVVVVEPQQTGSNFELLLTLPPFPWAENETPLPRGNESHSGFREDHSPTVSGPTPQPTSIAQPTPPETDQPEKGPDVPRLLQPSDSGKMDNFHALERSGFSLA